MKSNDIILEEPVVCRIKKGWDGVGKKGLYYGAFYKDQWWGIVVWEGEEDPEFFKVAGLEILDGWANIKTPNR